MGDEQFAAADGFVFAMLAMIGLSFGVVALLFICMHRNAMRRDHEVDDLLDEVSQEPEPPKPTPPPAEDPIPAEPWEKKPDWWKS